MKVCIVGNGPSAAGQGQLIDAADCVVRMKAWWSFGALDAGKKCDILAWFGSDWGWSVGKGGHPPPALLCEHWFTQPWDVLAPRTMESLRNALHFLIVRSNGNPVRFIPGSLWHKCVKALGGKHPSTGFSSVAMAIEYLSPDEIVLVGFDGTTRDKPNFGDARRELEAKDLSDVPPHDLLSEKRLIVKLFDGTWLGEPVSLKLTWIAQPSVE